MSDPKIPGRMRVDQIEQHQRWFFRCDDRAGFLLSIVWASDGDLHLSIVADPDHEDYEAKSKYISGSVRLRVPMIGGGMHEHLHEALITAMRKELAKKEHEARLYKKWAKTQELKKERIA